MSDYPEALTRLLEEHYPDLGDLRALIEKAGGDWGKVEKAPKPGSTIHFALCHLGRVPQRISRLCGVLAGDGYLTPAVAAAVDEWLASEVAWPANLPLPEAALALAESYPTLDIARRVALSAGLTEARLEQVRWDEQDQTSTWRSLLLVALVEDKLGQMLECTTRDGLTVVTLRERARPPSTTEVRSSSFSLPEQEMSGVGKPRSARGRLEMPTGQGGDVPGSELRPSAQETINSSPPRNRLEPQRQRDPRTMARLAQQRLELDALEELKQLMDRALHRFGHSDAQNAQSAVPRGSPVEQYVITVLSLREDVEASDESEVFRVLATLIATAMDGIDRAEGANDFESVESLAESIAQACEAVAEAAVDGGSAEIFRRVAPFWRMKAAYAGHQEKVKKRRALVEAQPLAARVNVADFGLATDSTTGVNQ